MAKLSAARINAAELLIYTAVALFFIGTVNIFSASFVLAGQLLDDSYYFLKRHLVSFAVGLVMLGVAARIDYRRTAGWLLPLVLLSVGLLVAVHFFGVEANGARRWLKLGWFKFQPSEFVKLTVIVVTAALLARQMDRRRALTLISAPTVIAGILGALVLKQPDMGTATVIVGLCFLLFMVAGIPRFQFFSLIGLSAAGAIYLVYAAPYRAERIMAWLDPWSYEQGSGYQTVQALLAIGSGGLTGSGLGRGASKFYYLPEAHTDFAFAVLCQEMGFIWAAVVLGLFALFAWAGIRIALKAPDRFGSLLAAGLTALIVAQAVGNVAMVTGLFPVTGVPLPFISYGGTSLMANLAAIGMLLSVHRASSAAAAERDPAPDGRSAVRRLKLVPKTP